MLFTQVCDRDFNRKHIGVNLCSLHCCVHEHKCVEKAQNLFQDVGDNALEISWSIARNFNKWRKLIISKLNPNVTCMF